MEKLLFQHMSAEERLTMLKDNCDKLLEDYGYEKPLSKEQIKAVKDQLAAATIELCDTQQEKKDVDKEYNDKIKDIKATVDDKVKQLKNRTTYTCELCFQILDRDEVKVGIYNKDGMLVEERPATMKELQGPENMFKKHTLREAKEA